MDIAPEWASNKLNGFETSIVTDYLMDPIGDRLVRSWSSKIPNDCLDFISKAVIENERKSELIGYGFSQWLQVNQQDASKWLAKVSDQPFADAAIKEMITWLDRRGQPSVQWKSLKR